MYIPPRTGTGCPTGICPRSGKVGQRLYLTKSIPYLARGVTDGFAILDSVPDPVVAK